MTRVQWIKSMCSTVVRSCSSCEVAAGTLNAMHESQRTNGNIHGVRLGKIADAIAQMKDECKVCMSSNITSADVM